jgi:poly [ADP-ribose] polymerase
MSRTAKLIFVSDDNHNKYYNMVSDGGTIQVEFGRVGATCQKTSYPDSKWESLIKSKIKKGYKEITHLFVEPTAQTKVNFLDISDTYISQLIRKLEAYTKRQVSDNYLVTANSVTQKQIEVAQQVLNQISGLRGLNNDLNILLLELFSIIPRKMRHVKDYLYNANLTIKPAILESVVAKEQELLDSMAQQVKQAELVTDNTDSKLTLLDAMGIEIHNIDPTTEGWVKGKLHDLKDNYLKAFKVVNKKTQARFDAFVQKSQNKKTDTFFHGSRNENWLPILQTGLVLRPTNAVISGKMFGYGTYYADKAKKSWGYTSARGSYWARGDATEAYMALFDVHLGNSLRVSRHESWCSFLDRSRLLAKGNYDSLFAEAGSSLYNNEIIVYTEEQSTIKYLIQMKG